ncbi:MAG: hypothetical protein HC769_24960 [Cyanobacteria bacterium CRU_2_1]|nr:hypothetical protein [Cyanobacteria bacterium CRU_2_1]
MTVEYVTHLLKTGDITVMGHIEDVLTVTGQRVSLVGAIEGQEQQNPPAIHVNFEILKKGGASSDTRNAGINLQSHRCPGTGNAVGGDGDRGQDLG